MIICDGPLRGVLSRILVMAGLTVVAASAADAPYPSRVISLAPHLTELVYAAGAEDKLVGVVEYSDFPEAAQQLPRIGNAFRIDVERILALEPDLILAWSSGNPAPMLEQLNALGFTVRGFEPVHLEDISAQLRQIGALLGTEESANGAADHFDRQLRELRQVHQSKPPLRVFLQISAHPLYTVGGTHIMSQMLDLCGAQNIFADLEQDAAAIDIESVLTRDPELILNMQESDAWETRWNGWPELSAVRYDGLLSVNPDWVSRATLRTLLGIEQMCAATEAVRDRREAHR